MTKNRSQKAKRNRQMEANSANKRRNSRRANDDFVHLFGIHAVAAAASNPQRPLHKLLATTNAEAKLRQEIQSLGGNPARLDGIIETANPKDIDQHAKGAVHQGLYLTAGQLESAAISDLEDAKLVVILDQITDPHNVGAIIRSSVALGADALIMTGRHSPEESGIMAKTASGGLDMITMVTVPNLARALDEIADIGFHTIGFDSEESAPFEEIMQKTVPDQKLALIFGSEGKGLRRLTREKCAELARLDMPGPIKSLNVSNAVAMTLYGCHLRRQSIIS
ncbi:TrmH family RNA methyltransferase [Cohaesibacter gelatinilyticus]|uniref:23S rRNA (Guanosine2251-2'-O)-methyltransferase n=1 Tax=Cohaesibacter gelatinilyticus TaxID=372072 RepID=A0A285NFZ8_9HYPH|nr:RNA methyltransferase [Cohaesibacter gelatinilyticus]SNZ08375.1 23S rRNA (guanosine2251-2'-O)-methyltransferase [Cohaesibacter gelatinilyticus]